MWSWFLLVASMLSSPSPSQSCDAALDRCIERLEQAPNEYESSRCLFAASKLPGCETLAQRTLKRLQKKDPKNHFLTLVSGHFYWKQAPTKAIEIYQRAAKQFHIANNSEGELIAQYNVLILLQVLDRTQSELRQQISAIQELSRRATTSVAKARALSIVASYKNRWNLDLGAIYERLTAYPDAEIKDFPYSVKREFFLARSKTAHHLLDDDQAFADGAALARAAQANHDQETFARARFDMAQALLAQLRLYPTRTRARRARLAIEQAFDAAQQSWDVELIARSILNLVDIQNFGTYGKPELLALTDLCLRVSLDQEYVSAAAFCHIAQSTLLQETDAQRAFQHALIAAHTLSGIGSLEEKILAWKRLLYASWERRPFAESMAVATVVVALLDELRERQRLAINRRKVFARQTRVFDWLSTMLDKRAARDPKAHATAFFVQELARGRVLTDEIKAARAKVGPTKALALSGQLESTFLTPVRAQSHQDHLNLDSLDKFQTRLLGFANRFSQAARAQQDPLAALTSSNWTADLAAELEDSEALLAYSFGRHDPFLNANSERSWVSVITKGQHRVVDLPWDLSTLRRNIDFLAGLRGAKRQAQEQKALNKIRAAIITPIVDALGPEIKQLVVIHDGALQNLPLASLAPEHALSVNPSATTWSMLAKSPQVLKATKSLVLTDPAVSHTPQALQKLRDICPALATKLSQQPASALPQSRLETTFIREHLDPELKHLTGPQANVQTLIAAWTPDIRHLHLSAHTLASPRCPDASALMLAPTSSDELGLLSAQKIATLKLNQALVVLGACSTAKGTQLQGEGVLSLARSFLMAGAQAVIASIWPVEDSEAKLFFKHFYAHLGRGIRVDEALLATQQLLKAKGYQNRAYAGYLVLGLGRHRIRGIL